VTPLPPPYPEAKAHARRGESIDIQWLRKRLDHPSSRQYPIRGGNENISREDMNFKCNEKSEREREFREREREVKEQRRRGKLVRLVRQTKRQFFKKRTFDLNNTYYSNWRAGLFRTGRPFQSFKYEHVMQRIDLKSQFKVFIIDTVSAKQSSIREKSRWWMNEWINESVNGWIWVYRPFLSCLPGLGHTATYIVFTWLDQCGFDPVSDRRRLCSAANLTETAIAWPKICMKCFLYL